MAEDWDIVSKQLAYLQVKRDAIEKASNDLDVNRLVQGCYARICVAVTMPSGKKRRVGRVARIDSVMDERDGEEVYKIPGGGLSSRHLKLSYDGKTKIVKVTEISSEDFKRDEIESYKRSCLANSDMLPDLNTVRDKRNTFRDFLAIRKMRGPPLPAGQRPPLPAGAPPSNPPLPMGSPPLPAGRPPLPSGPPPAAARTGVPAGGLPPPPGVGGETSAGLPLPPSPSLALPPPLGPPPPSASAAPSSSPDAAPSSAPPPAPAEFSAPPVKQPDLPPSLLPPPPMPTAGGAPVSPPE